MMGKEEFQDYLRVLGGSIGVISRIPLEEMLSYYTMDESIGCFIHPTQYIKNRNNKNVELNKRMIEFAIPLKKLAEEVYKEEQC